MALADRGTRLLLISAWNDSGGGALHRLLDGHSRLAAWPFELQLGNGQRQDAYSPIIAGKYRWPVPRRSAQDFFDSIADEELKSVLTRPQAAKHRAFPVTVNIDDWRDAFKRVADNATRQTLVAAYIDSFLALWLGRADAVFVVAHCPSLVIDAGEILSDFPDAKLIHVVRDPLAGIADFRRRHPGFPVEAYAARWSAVNEAAMRWRQVFRESILIIDFADLCREREAVMRRLARALGLPFEKTLLSPTWHGRQLNLADMGPFGGVPQVSSEREVSLRLALGDSERSALLDATESTREALGLR